MQNLESALQAFRSIVGPEHVCVDAAARAAEQATFHTDARIPAVVSPADRAEVQACVRAANCHHIPLYPVSTGLNWGYGSRVPPQNACVVLSLRRMNRILDFDDVQGHITLEPGVTMRQVHAFLAARRSRRMLSVTGGPPDSSVIGNICDRGMGAGPNADRFAHTANFEVVLPTGEHLTTGFGRFPGAAAAALSRWGVGPYLDGLFTQSNLGIVTRLTVWLALRPAEHQIIVFGLRDGSRLERLVDAMHELQQQGVPRTTLSLWNDYKLASMRRQYPFAAAAGQSPLPASLLAVMRRDWGGAAWLGGGAIFAVSRKHAQAERELIKATLRPHVDRLVFIDRWVAGAAKLARRVVGGWAGARVLDELIQAYEHSPHLGVPTPQNIRSVYWRKRTEVPEHIDPDRDRCGAIWLSPTVPFRGAHVGLAIRTAETRIRAHGFEPNISVVCLTERIANLVIALMYDREVPGEVERAIACYRELLAAHLGVRLNPSRLGTQSMDSLPRASDGWGTLMRTLKRSLDPNDILGPGRYDFRGDWDASDDA